MNSKLPAVQLLARFPSRENGVQFRQDAAAADEALEREKVALERLLVDVLDVLEVLEVLEEVAKVVLRQSVQPQDWVLFLGERGGGGGGPGMRGGSDGGGREGGSAGGMLGYHAAVGERVPWVLEKLHVRHNRRYVRL